MVCASCSRETQVSKGVAPVSERATASRVVLATHDGSMVPSGNDTTATSVSGSMSRDVPDSWAGPPVFRTRSAWAATATAGPPATLVVVELAVVVGPSGPSARDVYEQ